MSTEENPMPAGEAVIQVLSVEEPVLNREQRRALKQGKKQGAKSGTHLNPEQLRSGAAFGGGKAGPPKMPRMGQNRGK